MAGDKYGARRQKLLQKLQRSGVDALLVTNFTNVTYLTGFSGDDSYLLVGKSKTILVSDGRYTTQLGEECPKLDVFIRPQKMSIVKGVAQVAKEAKLSKIGFESNSLSYDDWETLGAACDGVAWVPTPGLVEELRLVKDADEITEIRAAIRQAEKGFATLRASLRGEQTELEVAHDLEHSMRRFGARGASFPPIVAVGPRAALPHARPTEALISESDFVLVDWGATDARGYKSDLTRVLATGKISSKLAKVYGIVLTAQKLGIEAIKPGVRCCDVDAAARASIAKAGYGKFFSHSLGHGIGLDIHEGPRLSAASETELKPGMVVTVEPGVYIPGWGGVRIEDDILVTRDGCEVLTSVPKELGESQVC